MTTTVVFSQRFPVQTKDMPRYSIQGPRVKPRDVKRAEMRRFLEDVLDTLEYAQCHFWACPGPDKPTRAMLTCNICYQVKRVRVMLGWLADEKEER